MKRTVGLLAMLLLAAPGAASAATKAWNPGWDIFTEPLDLANSNVTYKVDQTNKLMRITFTLNGATPKKLYQVGAHFFNLCPTPPAQFGQFSLSGCTTITRQGVTAEVVAVELGVVLTDASGDGQAIITVGPVASGTYRLEFNVRNGAGCDVAGGGGSGTCPAIFQSPGPIFGTTIKIRVD